MKSFLKKVVLFIALGFAAQVHAARPSGSIIPYEIGVASTTSFVQLFTGAGFVYDVVLSSAAAGDFTVCFDSASVTGLTTGGDGTATAPRLPFPFAVQAGTITAVTAHWINVSPVGVSNGLACANSAAKHANVLARPE